MKTIRVAALSGSLRAASYNTALVHEAARVAPDGVEVTVVDIAEIPLYNGDDEKLLGYPTSVQRLRDQIAEADALLIATPEYNGSVPGVLKNVLDWLSRGSDSPLEELPVATIGGAGRFGSSGAQRHLREVLHSIGALVAPKGLAVVRVWDELDARGQLASPENQDRLKRVVESLAAFTTRLAASTVAR